MDEDESKLEVIHTEVQYAYWRVWSVPEGVEIRMRVWSGNGWHDARATRVTVECLRPREHSRWVIKEIHATGPIINSRGKPGKTQGAKIWQQDTEGLPELFAKYANEFLTEIECERSSPQVHRVTYGDRHDVSYGSL